VTTHTYTPTIIRTHTHKHTQTKTENLDQGAEGGDSTATVTAPPRSFGEFITRKWAEVQRNWNRVAAWSSVLQCSGVQYGAVRAVQCGAVCCSAAQCVAVRCSTVQCRAVPCSMVQCGAVRRSIFFNEFSTRKWDEVRRDWCRACTHTELLWLRVEWRGLTIGGGNLLHTVYYTQSVYSGFAARLMSRAHTHRTTVEWESSSLFVSAVSL